MPNPNLKLSPDALRDLISGEGIRAPIGTNVYLRLVSKKTGQIVRVRLSRAIQLQGVGAGGWWLAMHFDDSSFNKFTSQWAAVGSFASAEPLRGWAMCFNKKWHDANKAMKRPVREQTKEMTIALWLQNILNNPSRWELLCRACDVYAA